MKERGPNKAVEETTKGSLEPASPEQTAADIPLDVGQFGPALEELLENYRSALRSIEQLRPVQRVAVEILRSGDPAHPRPAISERAGRALEAKATTSDPVARSPVRGGARSTPAWACHQSPSA